MTWRNNCNSKNKDAFAFSETVIDDHHTFCLLLPTGELSLHNNLA